MGVNLDKQPDWQKDVAESVDMYNNWFLTFAPATFKAEKVKATLEVEEMMHRTDNFKNLTFQELNDNPSILFALRMCTAPPIARDRLIGLADVSKSLVGTMEKDGVLPPRMKAAELKTNLVKIAAMITRLLDTDIFPWIGLIREPTADEVKRAATIVADRLCGANADPIVRNAQERRQLAKIKEWLEARGYVDVSGRAVLSGMQPGTFSFRFNVPGIKEDGESVNIPVDIVIMPLTAQPGEHPLLVEAKSAGDFTNVNKRRKEETTKAGQLRRGYGHDVRFILFLCGYFDSGYLSYNAGEGIDWVWEHRIDDLALFGI